MVTKKLTKTLLSDRPKNTALFWSMFVLLLLGLFSQLHWYYMHAKSNILMASLDTVINKEQYWRLFSATLVHSDLEHFLSNALFLFIFGYLIIGYFGFWIYPTICFFASALINYFTIITYPPQTNLLGASGMLYMMVSFWLILYFFIERHKSWSNRLIRIIGILLAVFFPTSYQPNVSYRAHFIGVAIGVFIGIIYFLLNKQKIRSHELWIDAEPEQEQI